MEYLYITVFEKAAAIAEILIINYPFVDGNKRIGFLAMLAVLSIEGLKLNAPQNATYNFIILISTGEIHFQQIVQWLQLNTIAISPEI